MQDAKDLKEYREHFQKALDNDFQRQALDKFAVAYPVGRANAFKEFDVKELIDRVARIKDAGLARLDELFEEFKRNAEAAGVKVHLARTAHDANEIIARIAKDNDCKKIIKSKSMTAEETLLNHHLEKYGLEVTESDLGEWIIQLRHEGPSHMVMPAIHLSRHQVADLFSAVTGHMQTDDIDRLVKVARRELRQKYIDADMGISGANFAIAETGTIGMVTNEGNGRLATTLPRVHVALVGLEKLCASVEDALHILRVLPRNATGQQITSYVTWISGPNECASAPGGKKEMHIVFLDNGRSSLAKDKTFGEVLRCVRCGACANVCPVYRMIGGHEYGHIYIGAIGLILTYFFHGKDKARNLVQNCINCQACEAICAAGINLPRIIKDIYAEILREEGHPIESTLLGKVLKNRTLFHGLLKAARFSQKPLKGEGGFLRHLPMMFAKEHAFKSIPAIADKSFREMWPDLKAKAQPADPKIRVALFSGCVQDFVYPEQVVAAIDACAGKGVWFDFPEAQSCCGLPAQMMGEKDAAREVAWQNINAFDPALYDYVLTLCASCASHLKHGYPHMLGAGPEAVKVQQFCDKVIDFSSFVNDVVGVSEDEFRSSGEKATFHFPCHLCRGMGVTEAPRELLRKGGTEYVQCAEDMVCCGFGGSYSAKFPTISSELLKKKLDNVEATGATILCSDCPGCIMQLRGGMDKRGGKIKVLHTSEVLAKNKK